MKKMTIGELYGPAMEITDQGKANEYFKVIVEHIMSHGKDLAEAQNLARQNLGYFAGYYDHETRLRVERLFFCEHPVFGAAAKGTPTPDEAFAAGMAMAKGN